MNLWNKIKLGTKFLFGGWESALDYLLTFLNEYLCKSGIDKKVSEITETASWALEWLNKLEKYVPEKWNNEYFAIRDVVADIICVTKDGQITIEEIRHLSLSFSEAKAKWDED